VHVLGADGVERPGWPYVLSGQAGWLALGDLDGDGAVEIVISCGNRVHVLNRDGQPFNGAWPRYEATLFGPPILADVDGDGRAEILVARSVMTSTSTPLLPTAAKAISTSLDTPIQTQSA